MLIIMPSKKTVFTTENLTNIYITDSSSGSWDIYFVYVNDKYRWKFKSETIAQRNLDNIVRAYHEGHREVYLNE